MRRLLLLVPILLLAGCNWPQGWHWPRTATSGSNTIETQIYIKDDVIDYQRPYVAWIARVWDQHPELVVHVTDTRPPVGYNVITIRTEDLPYPFVGATGISIGGNKHLLNSVMRLDPNVGSVQTDTQSKNTIYHEFCHALGGGFDTATQKVHKLCNREYHPINWDDVTRVYHDDPG